MLEKITSYVSAVVNANDNWWGARFWDIDSGQIKVGDVDIKDLTSDSLLKNMSMVFQKV